MKRALRTVVIAAGLVVLWQLLVVFLETPHYILPDPGRVFRVWFDERALIARHALTTIVEILLGLSLGAILGIASALVMVQFRPVHSWLMPVLVISQALPVFALAPILVLWLGYGITSKVAMAVLIIYFPVTAACYDGLRHCHAGWLDLARTMGASRLALLRHVQLPAALPAMASGIRIAASVAPIGAVVGEWVGSSGGLGYLMLHANARMQVDLMFAALMTLGTFAVGLYFVIDWGLGRLLHWQPSTAD